MKVIILSTIVAIGLSGCFGTAPIMMPCDKPAVVYRDKEAPKEPLLPWPDEPVHNLSKLTDGLSGSQKLSVVLQANKATINNLEETLKQTHRVESPK